MIASYMSVIMFGAELLLILDKNDEIVVQRKEESSIEEQKGEILRDW